MVKVETKEGLCKISDFFQKIGTSFDSFEKLEEALKEWPEYCLKHNVCRLEKPSCLVMNRRGMNGFITCQADKIVAEYYDTDWYTKGNKPIPIFPDNLTYS